MTRLLSLVLLAAGIVLLTYGYNALDSIGSAFSRFFSGAPTEKALLLLIGGGCLTAIGVAGLYRTPKAS